MFVMHQLIFALYKTLISCFKHIHNLKTYFRRKTKTTYTTKYMTLSPILN